MKKEFIQVISNKGEQINLKINKILMVSKSKNGNGILILEDYFEIVLNEKYDDFLIRLSDVLSL